MYPLQGLEGLGVMMGGGCLGSRSWMVAVSVALVMALVSVVRVRGVKNFSFGLTWWGRHGQLQLRVQSFTTLSAEDSAGGGGISGIFCAELVEREGDGDGEARALPGKEQMGVEDAGGGGGALQLAIVKKSRVMGTEMNFFFFGQSECCLDVRSKLALECDWSLGAECGKGKEDVDLFWREEEVRGEEVEGVEEVEEEEEEEVGFGVRNGGVVESDGGNGCCRFAVPEWACSLLEPLQLGAKFGRKVVEAPRNRKSVKLKEEELDVTGLRWQLRAEVFGKVQLGKQGWRDGGVVPGVVQGEKLTATARDDMVRIWESKHHVETLYLREGDSVSALDVDWGAGVASVGSSAGMLSLWDLHRAVPTAGAGAHAGRVEALQFLPVSEICVTGGDRRGGGGGLGLESSVSLWDPRMLARGAAAGGCVGDATVNGLRARGNQVFVRDAQGCISGLDIRKLAETPVERMDANEVRMARAALSSVQQSCCSPEAGESEREGKASRLQKEESRWWDAGEGYFSEEDDEEDGWQDGILCAYEEGSPVSKSSWIGKLIGEIKSQFHLGVHS